VRSNIVNLKKNISNVKEGFENECTVYERGKNKFYNYLKDRNISKPCTSENCSFVDLKNEIID